MIPVPSDEDIYDLLDQIADTYFPPDGVWTEDPKQVRMFIVREWLDDFYARYQ